VKRRFARSDPAAILLPGSAAVANVAVYARIFTAANMPSWSNGRRGVLGRIVCATRKQKAAEQAA
jgi:hypothetical protein